MCRGNSLFLVRSTGVNTLQLRVALHGEPVAGIRQLSSLAGRTLCADVA